MDINQLHHQAVAKLKSHETRFEGDMRSVNMRNATDVLRLVCIAQQRQIELLARVIAKLAPDLYSAEQLCKIEGLPDVDDGPDASPFSPEEAVTYAVYDRGRRCYWDPSNKLWSTERTSLCEFDNPSEAHAEAHELMGNDMTQQFNILANGVQP